MYSLFANHHVRDNIVFVIVGIAVFLQEPTIVQAQNQTQQYNPINFTEPLSLSRGSLSPVSRDSFYLNHEDSCRLVQQEFGWDIAECARFDNIIFGHIPGTDNIIVEVPNSEGYVKFDDWDGKTSDAEIAEIWDALVEGTKAQSEKLGITIETVKWVVYPHLNKSKNYMYYATLSRWNGEPVINIEASLFDRFGYVAFSIVPDGVDFTEAQLTQFVESTLASYTPEKGQSYAAFSDGDKVAAIGAMGVLASLVGVKYGKAAAGGILAVALVFLKKFWFVIFIPAIWVFRRLFNRKET